MTQSIEETTRQLEAAKTEFLADHDAGSVWYDLIAAAKANADDNYPFKATPYLVSRKEAI